MISVGKSVDHVDPLLPERNVLFQSENGFCVHFSGSVETPHYCLQVKDDFLCFLTILCDREGE